MRRNKTKYQYEKPKHNMKILIGLLIVLIILALVFIIISLFSIAKNPIKIEEWEAQMIDEFRENGNLPR